MSDPIRDLENFSSGGTPMTPLPAAEVRRRGDRLRRRNTTLLSVAGAVAVAAIVAAPLALNGGSDKAGPDTGFATQTPSAAASTEVGGAWLASIPEDFPLDEGVPAENQDDGSPVVVERNTNGEIDQLCGEPVDLGVDRLDEEDASYSDSTDARARSLSLYADDQSAQEVFDAAAAVVNACRPQPIEDGSERVTTPFEMETGDAAIGWTARTRTDGELYPDVTVWQLVRVGNALLLSILSQEIGSSDDAALRAQESAVAEVVPVTDAMNVFAAHPDAVPADPDGSQVEPRPSTSDGIPADFPIDVDLTSPEGDPLDGPSARAEGVRKTTLCDVLAWPSGGTARLAVTATGPEYHEGREVVRYARPDDAVRVMDSLRLAVRDCAKEPVGGGVDYLTREVRPDTGYDTLAFTRGLSEGLGGEAYVFTRVGTAILAVYTSGQYLVDNVDEAIPPLVDDTARITPVMCTFTAAGC